MDTTFLNLPEITFKPTFVKLVEITSIDFSISKKVSYSYLKGAYGEWVLLMNNAPQFYFIAFDEKGELNRLSLFLKEQNLDFGSALLHILKEKGYDQLQLLENSCQELTFSINTEIKEFEVLQIFSD